MSLQGVIYAGTAMCMLSVRVLALAVLSLLARLERPPDTHIPFTTCWQKGKPSTCSWCVCLPIHGQWAKGCCSRAGAGTCCRTGSLAPAVESCKKGVLKVDLQALTVGVAVLSMAAWLSGARDALLHSAQPALDASRKLAVVNGLGEHSRAQAGHPCIASYTVPSALPIPSGLLHVHELVAAKPLGASKAACLAPDSGVKQHVPAIGAFCSGEGGGGGSAAGLPGALPPGAGPQPLWPPGGSLPGAQVLAVFRQVCTLPHACAGAWFVPLEREPAQSAARKAYSGH